MSGSTPTTEARDIEMERVRADSQEYPKGLRPAALIVAVILCLFRRSGQDNYRDGDATDHY